MSCEPLVPLSIPSRCRAKTAWGYSSDNPKFDKTVRLSKNFER